MNPKKVIEKLEHDLCHFMIGELIKNKPERRGSPEMYKYKGLSVIVDTLAKKEEKTVSIRIGALEAEFKIDSGAKNSGALAPEEEKIITIWLSQNEVNYYLKALFNVKTIKKEIPIIPFDLENFYTKG